jgi:hypothetical protein
VELIKNKIRLIKNSDNKVGTVSPINLKGEKMGNNMKVLEAIEKRLIIGQFKYGKDIPIDDGRDWLEESIEEALDNIVYLTNYLLQIKERRDAGSNSNN